MADSDSIFNVDSLTKAAEAFDATPPDSLTAVENLDQDGEKLAEDMYQVFVSFKSSSTQLGKVDSDYSSSWQGRWDPLSESYGRKLEQARSIAIRGEAYIVGFNTNVADRFSSDASDVSSNVKLLKDWLETNDGDTGLKLESQQISQGFLDLSNQVTSLCDSFNKFASKEGAAYESGLEKLQRDVKNFQERITWEDCAAAEAQRSADGLVGGLAMIGGWFESFFTGGQEPNAHKRGTGAHNETCSRSAR